MKIKPFLVTLGLTSLLAPLAHAQLTVDIHVYDLDFGTAGHVHLNPTIQQGDTVHWVWDSGFHTTTSALGQAEAWDSGIQQPSFTFDHTFTQAGTFNYYCVLHGSDLGGGAVSGMSGSITVSPVPEPASFGLAAGSVLLIFSAVRKLRQPNSRQDC